MLFKHGKKNCTEKYRHCHPKHEKSIEEIYSNCRPSKKQKQDHIHIMENYPNHKYSEE